MSAAAIDYIGGRPNGAAGTDAGDTIATGALSLRRCRVCGEEYPGDYVVCPRDSTPLGLDRGSEDPLIGVVLAGTYRLVRVLGRGGMGRLYEASHSRLDRRYAVKVLHESHARSPDAVRRFDREARALSRIRSDHVLTVMDILRTPDRRDAIITACLEGEDLKARLDRVGKISAQEAVPLARQVCRGLAAAHAEGIVHRDMKPSNLFLVSSPDGRVTVKILDFGVAKLTGEEELTKTGAVLGTPAYMAPEQARGSSTVDARADIYAVGAVLYRMLTGRSPYIGDEPAALLASLLHELPKRPRSLERSIPVGLEAVIQRAMARDPDDRPNDALELEKELAAFDPGGDGVPSTWEPAAVGEPGSRQRASTNNTLILPRGSVTRAQKIAKRAARARPGAILLSLAAAGAAAMTMALVVVGFQTLDPIAGARTPVEQSAAWLLTIAAGIGGLSMATRWLNKRWSSAPDVLRFDRVGGFGLIAGAASFGALELVTRASDALGGTIDPLAGWSLLARAVLFTSAALLAGWVSVRKPPAVTR